MQTKEKQERESIFANVLEQVKEDLKQSNQAPSLDQCWKYVESLVELITHECEQRQSTSNTETINNEILYSSKTISDYKIGFELIVVYGIAPRLLNGVGIDAKKRLDQSSSKYIVTSTTREVLSEQQKLHPDNMRKLYQCVDCLLKASMIDRFFKTVIYEYYFVDILAAFIQIINHPISSGLQAVDTTTLSANASPASLAVVRQVFEGLPVEETAEINKIFKQLLMDTPEFVLIHNLLLLVSERAAAKWFSRICSSLLSSTIMRPKGVSAVVNAMLENVSEANLSKYDRVVQLIIKKPTKCKTLESYFKYICPQVISILHLKNAQKMNHLIRAGQLIAGAIIEKHSDLAKRLLLKPIFKPLLQFMRFGKNRDLNQEEETSEIVNENQLVLCVEDIHQLLFGNAPTMTLFNSISDIVPALFQLYCFISRTKLNLKSACEEIMTSYFKISSTSLEVIKSLLRFEHNRLMSYTIFAAGDSGGVCIKRVTESNRDYLWEARCMVNLLKLMKNQTVAGDLFVHLMTQFTVLKQKTEQVDQSMKQQLGVENEATLAEENIFLLQVIKLIIDELGVSIMKNTLQTVAFVKFLLLNHEEDNTDEDIEMVTMALGILSTIICGSIPVRTAEEQQSLADLQPILKRLANSSNEQIAEMAATSDLGIETKQYLQEEEEVDEDTKTEIRLRAILNDLKDPLLPVRAHGVRNLRALVLEKNNAVVKKHTDRILKIFQTQIKDEDSYVYFGAIQGLSAMADVFPDKIIPILCNSYENMKLPTSERLKIGESLLDVAERCGDMLPKYAKHFVFTFLKCSKETTKPSKRKQDQELKDDDGQEILTNINDNSSIIRASSLSNISDLSDFLKWGIHPYLSDILNCAAGLIEFDPSHHVRRAAVHIFSRLLNSFGAEIFNLFYSENELTKILIDDTSNNPLANMIRVLKRVEYYDKDHVVKTNAKTVLIDFEQYVMDRLTPKDNTEQYKMMSL